ncbi:hypothetical protein PMAYCL1PPCAC_19489, partial [Pristionchus mayeri]
LALVLVFVLASALASENAAPTCTPKINDHTTTRWENITKLIITNDYAECTGNYTMWILYQDEIDGETLRVPLETIKCNATIGTDWIVLPKTTNVTSQTGEVLSMKNVNRPDGDLSINCGRK